MENDNKWVNVFYVYETFLFIVGLILLGLAYGLQHNLFNYVGGGFVCFGMLMAFMQKWR